MPFCRNCCAPFFFFLIRNVFFVSKGNLFGIHFILLISAKKILSINGIVHNSSLVFSTMDYKIIRKLINFFNTLLLKF